MMRLNDTHDPARRSWVESANSPDSDFPIQNLPFGVFSHGNVPPRGGVAIGDRIVDLAACLAAELFTGDAAEAARACAGPTLNPLIGLPPRFASSLRARLSELLRSDGAERDAVEKLADRILVPMAACALEMPLAVGSFTDYLCSIDHSRRMGGGNLPEAFHHLPIAYHGRATSLRVSGTPLVRPNGQYKAPNGEIKFGPEPSLDFELEMAICIGRGNKLGEPIALGEAAEHIFGYCLLNDWSARGIQMWESRPLGPFLGKSFMTTVAPWIVTAEALAPFHAPAYKRAAGAPPPMPHLTDPADQASGNLDVAMTTYLQTPRMRAEKIEPARILQANLRDMYFTFAQMLTHHASNGCNLQTGDMLGSGTISGPTDDSRACLAELTVRGTEPVRLPTGETRAWLQDGDEVVFRARAERKGQVAIGFGECRGRVEPAIAWPVK
jgi:fumarylacetoacetase